MKKELVHFSCNEKLRNDVLETLRGMTPKELESYKEEVLLPSFLEQELWALPSEKLSLIFDDFLVEEFLMHEEASLRKKFVRE